MRQRQVRLGVQGGNDFHGCNGIVGFEIMLTANVNVGRCLDLGNLIKGPGKVGQVLVLVNVFFAAHEMHVVDSIEPRQRDTHHQIQHRKFIPQHPFVLGQVLIQLVQNAKHGLNLFIVRGLVTGETTLVHTIQQGVVDFVHPLVNDLRLVARIIIGRAGGVQFLAPPAQRFQHVATFVAHNGPRFLVQQHGCRGLAFVVRMIVQVDLVKGVLVGQVIGIVLCKHPPRPAFANGSKDGVDKGNGEILRHARQTDNDFHSGCPRTRLGQVQVIAVLFGKVFGPFDLVADERGKARLGAVEFSRLDFIFPRTSGDAGGWCFFAAAFSHCYSCCW
mmetsp:Transcript_16679/g.36464  ORF Transcript_16679/g.36464 Transcript_16679/m.36464 type:complete len:331 (-) Transcript_16679:73-1065(-)